MNQKVKVNPDICDHKWVTTKNSGTRCRLCKIKLRAWKKAQRGEVPKVDAVPLTRLPESLREAWTALCLQYDSTVKQQDNLGQQLIMFAARLKELDLALEANEVLEEQKAAEEARD